VQKWISVVLLICLMQQYTMGDFKINYECTGVYMRAQIC